MATKLWALRIFNFNNSNRHFYRLAVRNVAHGFDLESPEFDFELQCRAIF